MPGLTLHNDVYPAIDPKNFVDEFKGRVALVTGAGRGFGKGIVLSLAKAGADVALLARTRTELEAVAKEVEALGLGNKTCICTCDGTDTVAVENAVAEVVKTLGPIDILVNNAGANYLNAFVLTDFAQWWKVIEINLKAPFQLMQLVLPHMREKNWGRIINVSSRGGTVSGAFATSYACSKTALIRGTHVLQNELNLEGKDGVQLYSMHPGGFDTKMNATAIDENIESLYPGQVKRFKDFMATFNDTPELCGQTIVYMASGKAAKCKGRYFDVQHNIEYVAEHGDEVVAKNLYDLKVEFLDGMANDGGLTKDRRYAKKTE